MSTALAVIYHNGRPHQAFRVGYEMAARCYSNGAELIENYRAVRERLYARRPAVLRRPRDIIDVATPESDKSGWRINDHDVIVSASAEKHGVFVEQMRGHGRNHYVVAARHEAYYRMRTELGYSLPMIGKAMGGKDHSGVRSAIERYMAELRAAGVAAK